MNPFSRKFLFYFILPIFLTFFQLAFANEKTFQDRLLLAQEKDYVITEQNQIYSALIISHLSEKELILEEISIPKKHFQKQNVSWRYWLENQSIGATSWIFYNIDLEKKQISSCYSYLKRAWIKLSNEQAIFTKLLFLPFSTPKEDDLKKIGPPPMNQEIDHRPIWYPPMIIDGKAQKKAKNFSVYQLQWPEDGSELSQKTIDLYFHADPSFPFPYWVQINTTHLSIIFKAIDSGKNLQNPRKTFLVSKMQSASLSDELE